MLPLLILLPLPFTTAHSSSLTYFHPALGACGLTHSDTSPIAAISATLYDRTSSYGRWILVHGPAGSEHVQVADRCVSCAEWDLDVSPSVFERVAGSLDVGRTQGSWEWA
ncbi:hypothetical protein LIA77_10988 [Sarocladium implicatum]|nr:hypothetical protein LIA77_10988 [Sarocladium implicatum]